MPSTSSQLLTVLSPNQARQLTSLAHCPNPHVNHHHLAVVVSCKTQNVLASATNAATAKGSIHAEQAALEQLRRRLRDRAIFHREVRQGVDVLSLRIASSGVLRLAKPCAACAEALRRCPLVRSVSWSDDSGNMVCEDCSAPRVA